MVDELNPYRTASAPSTEDEDAVGHAAADRLKLRAALAEALLRASFVVLVLVSTVLSIRLPSRLDRFHFTV